MGFNVQSIYDSDKKTISSKSQKGFNVQSVRDKDKEKETKRPIAKLGLGTDTFHAKIEETGKQKTEGNKKRQQEIYEGLKYRYNINPEKFYIEDLMKWGEKHHYAVDYTNVAKTDIKPQRAGIFGMGEKLSTDQEDSDFKVLHALATNNERKKLAEEDKGAANAATKGAFDGATFNHFSYRADKRAKKQYTDAGLDISDYVSPKESHENTEKEHPVANMAGNMAGTTVSMSVLGKAVGAAYSSMSWFAKCPAWVQSAISSGTTFAIESGTETAFDGGSVKEVLQNAGINALGGAAGGAASQKVYEAGEKLLFNKKFQKSILGKMLKGSKNMPLQHRVVPEIILNGTSSAVFAGSKTASTYFLYPKEYRPTAGEMMRDMGVAFAFGAISRAQEAMSESSQSKRQLDEVYDALKYGYEELVYKNSFARGNENHVEVFTDRQSLAKDVVKYTELLEEYYINGTGFKVKVPDFSGAEPLNLEILDPSSKQTVIVPTKEVEVGARAR